MLQLWDRKELPGPEKEKARVLVVCFSVEGALGTQVQTLFMSSKLNFLSDGLSAEIALDLPVSLRSNFDHN